MANNNLPAMLNSEVIKNRFNEVLGKKAPQFTSALLNIYNGNEQLQQCDPRSILGAAGLAATVDLSITPSLGQAYIVPYKSKGVYRAQFMIGKRGLVQLAHRTGQYVALHAGKVYDGELKGFDPLTGEPERGEKVSDTVAGYIAYMRLNNGFEKWVYMSKAEIEEHAEKYSQSYRADKSKGWSSSPWTTNFDAMAEKTVLKKLLNAWGVLSVEMAQVIQGDQSVVDKNSFTYVDNKGDVQQRTDIYLPEETPAPEVPFDAETGEILEEVPANVQD